jgi:hypothetical protein
MGTVAADDSENRAAWAVSLVACSTDGANSAARVYLADHAFADKVGPVVGAFNDADEFVSDRSVKTGVTAGDLKIGIADSGEGDADERLIRRGRPSDIGQQEFAVFDAESFHRL